MKKRKWMTAAACAAILCIAAAVFVHVSGRKPYKNLDAAQIAAAKVRLTPPDRTVEIEDIEELAGYLRDVVIYREDNSYTEYAGQGVIFTLAMTDGTQTEIMAYNPFLVIDSVGYRTKYEPCEALNGYANRLLSSGNASIILEEPPTLSVVSDETAFGALTGGYSWQVRNMDGTTTGGEADCPHPLDCEKLLSPAFETPEKTAVLRFAEEPDAILCVECWSDAYWGEFDADGEEVPVDGNVLTLKPGGYVYEITAKWDTKNGCGGTASYYIYIKSMPDIL